MYHSGDCTICKTKELPLSNWGLSKVAGCSLKFYEPTTYMASWPDSSTALFVRNNRGDGMLHQPLKKIWHPTVYDKMLWQYQQTLTQQTTYLFSQRTMERKIDAHKGAWERGRKCVFSSFFLLMHCELTKSFRLSQHKHIEATGYESGT